MCKTQKNITPSALEKKINKLCISNKNKGNLTGVLAKPTFYVPDERFENSVVMEPILSRDIDLQPGVLLTAEQEAILFTQLNYWKYKLSGLRELLVQSRYWKRETIEELLDVFQKQLGIRSQIVTANIGLILAMAKKSYYPTTEFTDLVSEASLALIRCADRFNYLRGTKFSTYACQAITKSFYRAATNNAKYRARFPAQYDEMFEVDSSLEQKHQENQSDWVDELKEIVHHNLAQLSKTELSVVKMRFSLGRQKKPMTLKMVGQKLGLTKERIRQIQNIALKKLRITTVERLAVR